jgi:hypothetical protein
MYYFLYMLSLCSFEWQLLKHYIILVLLDNSEEAYIYMHDVWLWMDA